MIITSPVPSTIAQEIRKCVSMECGPLFVIDKMQCGMVRVRWCDNVLMALVPVDFVKFISMSDLFLMSHFGQLKLLGFGTLGECLSLKQEIYDPVK